MKLTIMICMLALITCESVLAKEQQSSPPNQNITMLLPVQEEDMDFRRKAFEEATLNYIELNLISKDKMFRAMAVPGRCKTLLGVEFVEYKDRANILHARLLLQGFGSEKDEELFRLLHEISDYAGISLSKLSELDTLLHDIESYREHCIYLNIGNKHTTAKLGQYVDNINLRKSQLESIQPSPEHIEKTKRAHYERVKKALDDSRKNREKRESQPEH